MFLFTCAVSERSFSTARRLKTWLCSSMNQIRFNNLATLMIHIATEQLILTWTKLPLSSPLEMIIESDILVYRCRIDFIVHAFGLYLYARFYE